MSSDPLVMDDVQRDAIASAIARGRERLASAAKSGDLPQAVRDVRTLSPWRREALAWTAENDLEHLSQQLTTVDLFLLGSNLSSVTALDAWGTSQASSTGCLCLRLLMLVPWESLAGRQGTSDVEAAIADLSLRLAEHMSALRVPAVLVPAIAALATQELIDNAAGLQDDDAMVIARMAAALRRERVEDYVAAVVGRGFARLEDASEPKP
jgi:hypothetical protein